MKQYNFLTIILFLVIITPLFSQSTSKVYFTRFNVSFGRVYSDGLGGGSSTILVNNIDRPSSVAIDWSVTPNKMYVAINGGNKITRYDINGTNPVDILTGQISVNDIELDLTNRKIYWINDTNSDDEILKADMDGVNSNITSLYSFTTDNNTLWGLAIDVPNNRLWITRRGSNCLNSSIVRMTLSGSSYTEIDGNICNPHDIEYYNNNIYFLMDDGLIKAAPDGTSQVSISASVSAGNGIYLAIDGLNNKAYWTLSSAVDRIDLGGTGETTIFSGVSSLMGIDTDYNNPAALPVELTSFTANLINNTIVLNWQTATEVNNYGFEVQRKLNLRGLPNLEGFSTIGFVEGHGNSNSPKDYEFTDSDISLAERSPQMGAYSRSYRLKQIDTDGSFEYSDIIELEMDLPSKFNLAQNYPNPFGEAIPSGNPSTVINIQFH